MPGTQKFPSVEKSDKKQNDKKTLKERLEGKKQMIVLWTTVLGLLSAEGIPAVVKMLSEKPSVEQVQAMIAKQTEELTQAQRDGVDAIKELDKKLSELRDNCVEHRTITGQLEGRTEFLKEVLRDCCTRRRARERLDREEPSEVGMGVSPSEGVGGHVEMHVAGDVPKKPEILKKFMGVMSKKKELPIERLRKVPDFNMQQQLQMQEPRN